MRAKRSYAFLILLCALGGAISAAQQSKPAAVTPTVRMASVPQNLLLSDDGLAVIAAALDSRNLYSDKADCSHLVHDIYERAGYPYTYVPSSDLYAGITDFRRVTRPQPGDLIVWPGHVGIVVSPTGHTFYSSLRSGLGVEPYDSDYWKRRGRPRFYRYLKQATAAVANNAKTPVLKSTSLGTNVPAPSPTPPVALQPETVQFPRFITVDSAKPTTQEVSESVNNAMSQMADNLRGRNIYGLPDTILVVNRIEVERVKMKGAAGWADVLVTQSASLAGTQSNAKKRQQKQRWILHRRDEQGWELVPPADTIYLRQDDAVKLLAQQLAAMTSTDSSDARRKSQLAALLGSMLQGKN